MQPAMDAGNQMKPEGFYIGWMMKAPKQIVAFIKKYLLIMFPLIILLGTLLALSQKKFGTGSFEYGQLTEVKGIYFDAPIPCLKVINGRDIWGNQSYLTIPLVGYGKHGASGILLDIESEKNIRFDKKQLVLKGTLLYNDGVTILQIDKNDRPVVNISSTPVPSQLLQLKKDLGIVTLKGEIIDPKCYFGVMKPGEGKPHRDCATRCILGGISPMLVVKNAQDESNYYLITGVNGESMNEAVKEFVAEPVEIKARLVQYDDWIVARIDSREMIKRYSYLRAKFGNSIQLCTMNDLK